VAGSAVRRRLVLQHKQAPKSTGQPLLLQPLLLQLLRQQLVM